MRSLVRNLDSNQLDLSALERAVERICQTVDDLKIWLEAGEESVKVRVKSASDAEESDAHEEPEPTDGAVNRA